MHRKNFYSTFSRSIVRTFGTREVRSHIIAFIRRVVFVVKGATVSKVFGVELIDFRIRTNISAHFNSQQGVSEIDMQKAYLIQNTIQASIEADLKFLQQYLL